MLQRDIWIPVGDICRYDGGTVCVFYDHYDWLTKKHNYCVRFEKTLGYDETTEAGVRCAECLRENPDPVNVEGK